MVKVVVPVADGSEDIETTCITDTLVRAGIQVITASVMGKREVTFARGLHVIADTLIDDIALADADAVVLPGGMPGAQHFKTSAALQALLAAMKTSGKIIGAICASPYIALGDHKALWEGVAKATCFPAFQDKFRTDLPFVEWSEAPVVVSGNMVTSQGPGTALRFGLCLVGILVSEEKATELKGQMLFQE